jgi:P-type Ca2+ transporter type 2C
MIKKEGLTSIEAKRRLDSQGFNEIRDISKISLFKILLRQIKNNFIVYLLTFATIISFLVNKTITAYTILVIILIVIITGFIQEYRSERAIESLKKLVMPISIVIRDGVEKEILSKEIVSEDILVLRSGERIPADCVILEERDLSVNESVLTGESREIFKKCCTQMKNIQEENIIYAGSFIVNGKCLAKVIHTGMETRFGKIAGMISSAEKELPLQKKINKITKRMALIGIFMAFLTGISVLMASDFSKEVLIEILILIIAISVSAFPEGFPVVLITTLSMGAYKMAKKNSIVNRMSIIETLGETTVICSDKTGTITKGEMTARKIYSNNKIFEVTGVGYEGNGDFLLNGDKINLKDEQTLNLFLKASVLCNDARIQRTGEDKLYDIFGLPTEASLLVMASKIGIYKEDFNKERQEELPFSSERKMMTVLVKEKSDSWIYSKGALEVLIKKCSHIQRNDGVFRLLERDKNRILKEFQDMASNSLRTIALAYKKVKSCKKQDLEKDLIFLGFVGMEDPPREEVKEALRICKRAGISVKMITGDNKETALAISNQIGLDKGKILEGDYLDKLTDFELVKIVRNIVVFARVKPEHKLRIVKALKENGEIVTMTGDGVNDSPALKEAHIGVAMGKSGTDVSRSVSDLTLKDDNFATIVDAIKEGRTIFNNIRKFVSYQLSCNVAELSILFIGVLLTPFLGWPIPLLLALHILLMNMVTADIPAITLGLNKSSNDIMEEKPRKDARILTKNLVLLFVFVGALMCLFTLGIFWFTFNFLNQSVGDARTTALVALIFLEIAVAFNFRSFRKGVLNRNPFVNKHLVIASLISILITLAVVYTPLNNIFDTVPIPFVDWMIALGFSILLTFIFDLLKKYNNKKCFFKID